MIILGLGSNIGDRLAHLGMAVKRLSAVVQELRLSRIFESPALLPENAPPEWNMPYLNMAVSGTTALAPMELLVEIKAIEQALGRASPGRWGPRAIDIDILAMDEMVMNTPELTIPHPGMVKRDFVLLPVSDVVPEWRYPLAGPYHGMSAADISAAQGFMLHDTGWKLHD